VIQLQATTPALDPLLTPLLAAGEAAREEALARLIADEAAPLVRRIVRHSLGTPPHGDGRPQDAEDVCGEVLVQLLARLRECQADPRRRAIANFHGYVAVAAHHACHERLRRQHPARHALKDRLRYLLTRQPGLALWLDGGHEMVCGFAAWREQARPVSRAARPRMLAEDAPAFIKHVASRERIRRMHLAELAAALFDYFGGPVRFDDLVSLVAELCDIRDRAAPAAERRAGEAEDTPAQQAAQLPAPEASAATRLEQRDYLARLWAEVRRLPVNQRTALLLNLRDAGGGVIHLLPVVGVASVRAIAETLEMRAEQFAVLWARLPLDDLTIAGHLGVTRQQVINLRQAARKRLRGRLGQWK
jgi:DNA-directed RNA polymerase specialized sigma24 family protein